MRSLRLMVVDDNEDAAQTLGHLLAALGHHVATEYGGREALDRARAQVFDGMILDIGMPNMNGYELAQHIGAIPHNAQAVLIALTGYGTEEDIRQAKEAGFNLHLTKPANLAQITEALAVVPLNPGQTTEAKSAT